MLFVLSLMFFVLWLVALQAAVGTSLAYLAFALAIVLFVAGVVRRTPRRAKSV